MAQFADLIDDDNLAQQIARQLCRSNIRRDTTEALNRAIDELWPCYVADARKAIALVVNAARLVAITPPTTELTGWASSELARAYAAIERERTRQSQPTENPIDETLRKALEAVEVADEELAAVGVPFGILPPVAEQVSA